jgi:NAD(P)-dependent dehydrogenase (short-subunit alcohol dehydrogenase family)
MTGASSGIDRLTAGRFAAEGGAQAVLLPGKWTGLGMKQLQEMLNGSGLLRSLLAAVVGLVAMVLLSRALFRAS